MDTIDDVRPDTVMTLTDELDRLFKVEGCDPACHACLESIELGQKFKLASTAKGRDVMLCDKCTIPDLIRAERNKKRRLARLRKLHPGFSRPSVAAAPAPEGETK